MKGGPLTADERNEYAARRWLDDYPARLRGRDFDAALGHIGALLTAISNLRGEAVREEHRTAEALTTERTRREAAEREVERLTMEDLPAAKAMTERVGAMYRAEVQRREAAERRADENAEALSALHDEIDDALPEYTCDAVGTAANHVERVAFAGRDLASLRERAEKAEAERDEVLELVALLRRSAETSAVFDDLASRTSGLLAKTHEAELASAVASRDAALAALASVVGTVERYLRESGEEPGVAERPVLDALALAASPAALGAKVIEREQERGAVWATRKIAPYADEAWVTAHAAEVCKAAGGAR